MFKKLQNKFLIINMVSILIMFLISFSMIYFVTYQNTQKEQERKLEQASQIRLISSDFITTDVKEDLTTEKNSLEASISAQIVTTDFSVPFNLILNQNNEITKINSYLKMTNEEYQELAQLVIKHPYAGYIRYKNKDWKYKISSIENMQVIGSTQTSSQQKQISFLDITEDNRNLNKLLITLLAIGLCILIIIYFISLYFAKKSIKPIKESWEKQKQFVEDASHELKTPIASIKANTEVLLLNTDDTIKEQTKWIEYIKLETDKMTQLANQLLKLAKMENKEENFNTDLFNLSNELEESINSMEAIAFEKKIKIEKEIEENIFIKQKKEVVKQILSIITENALKYTNINGNIKFFLKRENRKIKLSIQNTGPGIPKEDLPHIFDRFYRVDKSRNASDNSYGLGLSIAKSAMEKIGGKILVQSIPDKETTFTLIFANNK